MSVPTCLVSGHSDRHGLFLAGVLLRHSVHRPDFKGVVGVCQEVGNGDFGGGEAVLLGAEVHTAAAGPAAAGVASTTPLADHIIGDVFPTAFVLGRAPLQVHRCLVDVGNQVLGSRWRT